MTNDLEEELKKKQKEDNEAEKPVERDVADDDSIAAESISIF